MEQLFPEHIVISIERSDGSSFFASCKWFVTVKGPGFNIAMPMQTLQQTAQFIADTLETDAAWMEA